MITRDRVEKVNRAAELSLLQRFGVHEKDPDGIEPLVRGGSITDIGRSWLHAHGEDIAMTRYDLTEAILGDGRPLSRHQRRRFQRDAANVTSGMFTSYLLANVMDKAIYNAFMASEESITYHLWTASRQVSDFKTFAGAGLDIGNLQETAENVAFPELAKGEGGYNASLGLWGGTISLTMQALLNDDLHQFMKTVQMAGFIARRTIDAKVYAVLEAASWTGRTTAGDLTDDTLSANRASMAGVQGPSAAAALGMVPRFLIVPTTLRSAALKITQLAPYLVANDGIKVNTDIVPIITPRLTNSGTPSQSTWYLAVGQQFEPVVVATLEGTDAPMLEEYSGGAVAARKWKVMMPFVAVLPMVGSAVQGMWRGTHA